MSIIAALFRIAAHLSALVAGVTPDCWEDEAVVVVVANFEGGTDAFANGTPNPLPAGTLACVPWDDMPTQGHRP